MNYKEKKNEIMEKYVEPIKALSRVNNVDMGVAFDMFQDNVTHGTIRYQYVEFNVEEAKKDFEELLRIAGAEVKSSEENVAESAE